LILKGDLSMEVRMFNPTRLTIAALALLSGISVAAAAGNHMAKSSTTGSAASSSNSATMARDELSLTGMERKTAWKDISSQAVKEKAPTGFTVKVGAKLPSDISISPVPVSTPNKVPDLRPYQYALLNSNKLLIVNPDDRKVVKVITQ
jgi:hypothetical protein